MKIGIATPMSKPTPNFIASMDVIIPRLEGKGHEVVWFKTFNNSMLDQARNMLVENLKAINVDYIFFVDDDMYLQHDTVDKLLSHKKDIVCTWMCSKNHPFAPTFKKIVSRDKVWDLTNYFDYPTNELFEIGACGMAATLIDVRVFDDTYITNELGKYWFRMGGEHNGLPFSEDFDFCLRARDKGYKIYCDSSLKTRHIGGHGVGEENWLFWKERLGAPIWSI
jgi:hypothetical protein